MPGKREFFYPFAFVVIILLILVGLTWANGRFLGQVIEPDAFRQNWTAANHWLQNGINPYTENPPLKLTFLAMIFLAPFGILDLAIARALWMTAIEASLVLITIIAIHFSGWKHKAWTLAIGLLISMTWYFGIRAVFLGQLSVLILLVLMISLLLIVRKQDGLAGFALALSLALPSYSFLVIVFVVIWSLAARRYQILLSLLAGTIFLLSISVILLPAWPLQWLRLAVGDIKNFNWRTSTLSGISNSVSGIRIPLSIALNGSALILLISEWLQSFKHAESKFAWAVLFTITINCLIKLNSEACDTLALLPVLFYTLKVVQDRWVKAADISALISGVFLLIFPWLIVINYAKHHTQVIPIFMVIMAGLSILGLLWIKWWARRPAQLPLEILRDRIG